MAGRELIDTLVFSVSASLFISGIAWECGYLTPVLNLQLLRGDVNQDVLMHLSFRIQQHQEPYVLFELLDDQQILTYVRPTEVYRESSGRRF